MPRRPNILILMPDQMTAGAVAAAGRGIGAIMPNAQRLAATGIRFNNACTVSPHCCPARATFFTGHLPSRHGVWNNIDTPMAFSRQMNDGIGTFAEMLAGAGYQLAFSGKWHVSKTQSPESFGWKTFAPADPPSMPRRPVAGPLPGGDGRCDTPPQDPRGDMPRPGWPGGTRLFHTLAPSYGECFDGWRVVQSGVSAIRELSRGDAPWCIFVSTNAPHDPYGAPLNYLSLYGDDTKLPRSFGDDMADKPRVIQRQRRQLWDRMGEAGARECLRHYLADCSMVDDWLGILLDELDDSGQADNTLVLLTADHGDYAGAHGLWCKGVASFREAYDIPAIIRWPAGIASPGRECDELVSIADFMPTFLELAGLQPPADIYGRSMAPMLAGSRPSNWRDVLITQYNGAELYYTQRIVRDRNWKYVFNGFDYDELYDLRSDPHEMVNLADPSRQPAAA
jgi:arylsulfatase A-like enzyme